MNLQKLFFAISFTLVILSCSKHQSAEEYFKNGIGYYEKKQWPAAIIEFKNAVKESPEDARARAFLGKSYLEVFNFEGAIKELERAKKLGYDNSQLVLPLATAFLAVNNYSSIIEEFHVSDEQALGVQARLHAIRASALIATGKQDDAYEELKTARSIDESAQEVRLAWGRLEQGRGNTGAQRDWIKPLLDKDGGVAEAWSQLGEIELTDNHFSEAEKAFTRAIEIRQYPNPDLARRALTRIELKKFDAAKEDIDTLKSLGLTGPIVQHADGVIAYYQERTSEAKTIFQQLVASHPNYAPPRFLLALIHFSEKDYTSANAHLNVFTTRHPEHGAAKFLHASTLIQLRQPEQAIQLTDELLNKNSQDIRLYLLKGNALAQQGKLPEALDIFKDGLRLDPNNADIHYRIGLILGQKPETLAQSEMHLKRASELAPDASKAQLVLYLSYLRQKKFDQARQLANSFGDDQLNGQNLIGLSYLAEGKTERAIQEFERILQQNEGDSVTIQNLAKVYIDSDRLDEAKKLLSSAVQQKPGDIKLLNQLAMISERQGNSAEVLDWLKQSMENNPDELSPRLILALQYLRSNEASSAIQVLNGVNDAGKENARYLLLMSQAKLAMNEHAHSIRLLKTLLAKEPELVPANFLLALAYSKDNDLKRMRESLEKTVELAPAHFLANLYLARLDLLERRTEDFMVGVDRLVKIDAKNSDVRLLQAKKASLEKKYPAAIAILTELKKTSNHPEIYLDLAENQRKSGRLKDAIATLEKWTQSGGSDARISLLLAQSYMENLDYNQARSVYVKLEKELPDNIVVLNNLAWLMREEDVNAGIGYGNRALEIQPDNPLIMDTVAMLYLANQQPVQALELASKAASALPENVEIQVNYARALVSNGSVDKGRNLLNELKRKTKSAQDRKLIDQELRRI